MMTKKSIKKNLLDELDIDDEFEDFLGYPDIGEDEEEQQKPKRLNTKARQRLDRGKKPFSVREPLDSSLAEIYKDQWDCLTLGVERVPYDPYVKPKMIETHRGVTLVATSAVGETRNYGKIMAESNILNIPSSSEKPKSLSAYEYIRNFEGEDQANAIADRLHHLLKNKIFPEEYREAYNILTNRIKEIKDEKSKGAVTATQLSAINDKYNTLLFQKYPPGEHKKLYSMIGRYIATADKFVSKLEKLMAIDAEKNDYLDLIDSIQLDLSNGIKFNYPGLRYPEWLHSVANSAGGCLAPWNAAAGSYAANTQMAVVENAITNEPGIGIQVKTYTKPDARIAEWYEYKVIAYDENGNTRNETTFYIDARRDWYGEDDYKIDDARIKKFLADTKEIRKNVPIPTFQLPEIQDVKLVNRNSNNVLSTLHPGPIFYTANSPENHQFGQFDDHRVYSHHMQSGYNDYKNYRERMAIKYPYHSAHVRDLIIKGNLLDKSLPHNIDHLGNNLLHYACLSGRDITALLKAHPELNVPNKKGLYPVHLLAETSINQSPLTKEIKDNIRELISHNPAALFSKDINGASILHIAARAGDAELINNISATFINTFKGCSAEQFNTYRQLLLRPDNQGNTILHIAAEWGNTDFIEKYNAWFNNMHSNTQSNKYVLQDNALKFFWTPNKKGNTPLHEAAKWDHPDTIEAIVKEFKIDNDDSESDDDEETATLKLVDTQNNDGNTALHLAQIYQYQDAYDALMSYAEPTIKNNEGLSVLDMQSADSLRKKDTKKQFKKIISAKDGIDINLDYEYQTEEINALSRGFHKEFPKGVPVHCLNAYGNLDGNIGIEAMRALLKSHKPPMKIAIPYNEGGAHWVGVVIEISGDNKCIIKYIDPLNRANAFDKSPIKNDIETVFGKINGNPEINLLKQKDGKACGAYTIENLKLAILGNTLIPQSVVGMQLDATKIRYQHIKELEKSMPTFAKKQWDNIPIPAHAATIIKHRSPYQYSDIEKKQVTQIQEVIAQLRKLDKTFDHEIQVVFECIKTGSQTQFYDHGPTYTLFRAALATLAKNIKSEQLPTLQQLCALLFKDGAAAYRQYSQKLPYDGFFISDGIKIFEAVVGVSSVTPQQNTSSPSASGHVFKNKIVELNKIKINLDYEYQTEEINHLFNLLPKQSNETPPVPIFYLNAFGNLDGDLFRIALKDVIAKNAASPKKIALAYNEGNSHWVGITIEYDKDNNITVKYLDSLPRGRGLHPSARADIEAIIGKNFKEEKVNLLQQADYKACGAYNVENLKWALSLNVPKTQPTATAAEIRAAHIIALHNTGVKSFYQKQYDNKTIASISETLAYHQSPYRYSKAELDLVKQLITTINDLKSVDKKFAAAIDLLFAIMRQSRNDQTSDTKIICDNLKSAIAVAIVDHKSNAPIAIKLQQLVNLIFKRGGDAYLAFIQKNDIPGGYISDVMKILDQVAIQLAPKPLMPTTTAPIQTKHVAQAAVIAPKNTSSHNGQTNTPTQTDGKPKATVNGSATLPPPLSVEHSASVHVANISALRPNRRG